MHSRVAAVKAPRTHNRRRVTGSSGRRRGGRESERQRPNMSRRVFASAVLLLLLVMMCSTGGAVQDVKSPVVGSQPRKSFVWRDVKKDGGETVESLRVPSLVELKGDVFAVAHAYCKGKDENEGFTGIALEVLALTDKQSKELDTVEVKTQVLVECPSGKEDCASKRMDQDVSQENKRVDVSQPTTVVKGNDIYMLAGVYMHLGAAKEQLSAMAQWGLLLLRGNFSGDDSNSNKKICWNYIDVLQNTLNIHKKNLSHK
ncbi:trans-sialidase, putative [Trypanosoma cruzi marinkellei]|uniref:Trans-sialidase, putative n=1 Tax=Trypanosoma cruzi marinkellei TaxID=85056 RepID=K2NPC9_TRYCR|nr:trans-sialidase, putative [Trypanosoma cruzi marinkellei]